MGVAATPALKGLGPQNPTKKLAHVGIILGHQLSQNRVPKHSDPGPPPLKMVLGEEKSRGKSGFAVNRDEVLRCVVAESKRMFLCLLLSF